MATVNKANNKRYKSDRCKRSRRLDPLILPLTARHCEPLDEHTSRVLAEKKRVFTIFAIEVAPAAIEQQSFIGTYLSFRLLALPYKAFASPVERSIRSILVIRRFGCVSSLSSSTIAIPARNQFSSICASSAAV